MRHPTPPLSPANGGEGVIQMQAHAANEAGQFAVLAGMADEAGGFVENQQIFVFVDDVEEFFQVRESCHKPRQGRRKICKCFGRVWFERSAAGSQTSRSRIALPGGLEASTRCDIRMGCD